MRRLQLKQLQPMKMQNGEKTCLRRFFLYPYFLAATSNQQVQQRFLFLRCFSRQSIGSFSIQVYEIVS